MVDESVGLHRQMEKLIADIRREGDEQAATWRRCIDRVGVAASAENLGYTWRSVAVIFGPCSTP